MDEEQKPEAVYTEGFFITGKYYDVLARMVKLFEEQTVSVSATWLVEKMGVHYEVAVRALADLAAAGAVRKVETTSGVFYEKIRPVRAPRGSKQAGVNKAEAQ